jgi:NodT family efflux transporter outer membrane factor (OMF) lipoprotein
MKTNYRFDVQLFGLLASGLLAGCAVGPNYARPDMRVPTAWQAPVPHGGKIEKMDDWWGQFKDPVLTELQQAAQNDSPTLDKAVAAISSARASVTTSRASGIPSLSASAKATRSGNIGTPSLAATTTRSGLDASWELDLFGGVRRSVESATATVEARQADWHNARVSLAAEVATNYVDYRACYLKLAAYEKQAHSYQETQRLTRVSVAAGFSAPVDLALVEAGAASASSSATAQQATCDLGIKALVAVTGLEEMRVRELLGNDITPLPTPTEVRIESIPAALISQRPDIVSSERQLAAAMAKIGVAEAGRWPSLSLSGSIAVSHAAGVATTPWSLAPVLSLPLFNAGSSAAKVDSARADYDSALATYKSSIRTAVKEVEQALVNLDSAARREGDARTSATQYRSYFRASEINWQSGRISLLDLETARRTAISAEVSLIDLNQTRVDQWITLYKALGGSWQSATENLQGESK